MYHSAYMPHVRHICGLIRTALYGVYELDFFGVDVSPFWYFSGESAVILHGCTPPNSAYFSYRSYLGTQEHVYDPFPIEFASLGDSINQLTLNFSNAAQPDSPFDALYTVVTTADQVTFADISAAFASADLRDTLNADIMPNFEGGFVFGKNPAKSDIFTFLSRIAIPFDEAAYAAYIEQKVPIYLVSSASAKLVEQYAPRTPFATPALRERTSAVNESALYSQSVAALTSVVEDFVAQSCNLTLRRQSAMDDFDIEGFECIEDGTACFGDNHDAAYLKQQHEAGEQWLTEARLFVVLGVNHNCIDQTVYSNVALYKVDPPHEDETGNGSHVMLYSDVGGITNFDDGFLGSAEFFDDGAMKGKVPDADKLFVVAIGRENACEMIAGATNGSVPCMSFDEEQIKDEDPFLFASRAYLNPTTRTGPSYQQIVPNVILQFEM